MKLKKRLELENQKRIKREKKVESDKRFIERMSWLTEEEKLLKEKEYAERRKQNQMTEEEIQLFKNKLTK